MENLKIKSDGTIDRRTMKEYRQEWDYHCSNSRFHQEYEGNYNPHVDIILAIESYITKEK